jgi:hypothetical protein
MMTRDDARNLLAAMRMKYKEPYAFYEAAKRARMSASDFGKLLHQKDKPKSTEKQLEMF